jgi:hypothetical protein
MPDRSSVEVTCLSTIEICIGYTPASRAADTLLLAMLMSSNQLGHWQEIALVLSCRPLHDLLFEHAYALHDMRICL